jgi:gamma-glutamyl AIG2-like cyclotransferase
MPLLFSYGTLQEENVQLSTFGRRLDGRRDELPRFERSLVKIEDLQIVAATGRTHDPNVRFNGNEGSRVPGMVFEVTEAELASADEYERAFFYKRVVARLASGRHAWVYVHEPSAPWGL